MGEAIDLLREQLERALGADYLLVAGAACERYAVQGRVPALVARPGDVEGVGQTLALATDARATVVPWGGGTRMALGYPPPAVDLVLSLERLNRVRAHERNAQSVTVQAGCTLETVAQTLAGAGQMLPLDVPLPARATIGGTLATGMAGPRRLRYGGPRDVLVGVRVVDALGAVTNADARSIQSATGYDFNQLLVGSLGMLGVLVEADFKLAPLPSPAATLLAICPEPARALAVAEALRDMPDQPMWPAAVCALGLAGLPHLAAGLGAAEADVVVAADVSGAADVERTLAVDLARVRVGDNGHVRSIEGETHDALWSAITDFPALADLPGNEALLKVQVLPSELRTVLEVGATVIGEHGLRLTWLADAAMGVLYLRVRAPAGASGEASDAEDAARGLGPGLRALQGMLAHRWRSAVVLACAPALKAELPLWGADPPGLDVMRALKRTYDPAGILNPGRFLSGS
jgi:glycolate oxidase FAD binding subunit